MDTYDGGQIYYADMEDFKLVYPPEPTWEAMICNFHYPVVKPPNRFHRFMQRLCFGIKWERL